MSSGYREWLEHRPQHRAASSIAAAPREGAHDHLPAGELSQATLRFLQTAVGNAQVSRALVARQPGYVDMPPIGPPHIPAAALPPLGDAAEPQEGPPPIPAAALPPGDPASRLVAALAARVAAEGSPEGAGPAPLVSGSDGYSEPPPAGFGRGAPGYSEAPLGGYSELPAAPPPGGRTAYSEPELGAGSPAVPESPPPLPAPVAPPDVAHPLAAGGDPSRSAQKYTTKSMQAGLRGEEVSSADQLKVLITATGGLLADAYRNYRGEGAETLRARVDEFRKRPPDERMAGNRQFVDDFLNQRDLVTAVLKGVWGWTDADVDRYSRNPSGSPGAGFKVEYFRPDDPASLDRLIKQHAVRPGPGSTLTIGDPPRLFTTSAMMSKASGAGWAIFVMDGDGQIFAGEHKVGLFHHSSFLGGAGVAAAGEIKVDNAGRLVAVTAKSGHYLPTPHETRQFVRQLSDHGVQLGGVEVKSWEEEKPGGTVTKVYDAAEFLANGTNARSRRENQF